MIGIVCGTARKLGVSSLTEVQALGFEQMLGKAGIALGGLKQVLAVYGVSVDGMLDSFRAETKSRSGDRAVVHYEFQSFGVKVAADTELVLVGDRWVPSSAAPAVAAD